MKDFENVVWQDKGSFAMTCGFKMYTKNKKPFGESRAGKTTELMVGQERHASVKESLATEIAKFKGKKQ